MKSLFGIINYRKYKQKQKSLQAQVLTKPIDDRHISDDYGKGSATVEAALVFPFILCALCTVCVIAQFLISESAIYHATSQTAEVYAKQESCSALNKKGQAPSALAKIGSIVESNVLFSQYLDKVAVNSSYVLGGKNGVVLATDKKPDYVTCKATYMLKVPVPLFQSVKMPRTVSVQRRMFTGYIDHSGDGNGLEDDDIIYVAEYGGVYHTDPTCYHICITINDPQKIEKVMESSHKKQCEKCLSSGDVPSELYTTKAGDCYHSSPTCSGLKRTVIAVRRSEVSGLNICSECAKHQ